MSSMFNPKERRHYPRSNIKLPVVMIAGESLVDGEIQDISLGGAFIRCPTMPNPKDSFHMVISSKGRLISIIAEVVWSDGHKFKRKAALSGIGVRFRRLLHGDRRFIANMVAKSLTISSVARLSMKIKDPLKGRQRRSGVINV
ncbi:PilZ domain-containing protein [Candidatus Bathyarchaeota archaeon]|nr:PilZ domain-containing protein [Candidatus Bathyarchaeota archaeon]